MLSVVISKLNNSLNEAGEKELKKLYGEITGNKQEQLSLQQQVAHLPSLLLERLDSATFLELGDIVNKIRAFITEVSKQYGQEIQDEDAEATRLKTFVDALSGFSENNFSTIVGRLPGNELSLQQWQIKLLAGVFSLADSQVTVDGQAVEDFLKATADSFEKSMAQSLLITSRQVVSNVVAKEEYCLTFLLSIGLAMLAILSCLAVAVLAIILYPEVDPRTLAWFSSPFPIVAAVVAIIQCCWVGAASVKDVHELSNGRDLEQKAFLESLLGVLNLPCSPKKGAHNAGKRATTNSNSQIATVKSYATSKLLFLSNNSGDDKASDQTASYGSLNTLPV